MARARGHTQSRGSVARLLDTTALEQNQAPVKNTANRDFYISRYRKRQVVLDDTADANLERLTEALRRSTGTRLTTSHAVRALLAAFSPSTQALATMQAPPDAMFLPNNAPRFAHERIAFERSLSDMLVAAMLRGR